jgi:hypothetical protein
MESASAPLTVKVVRSLGEVAPAAWDALVPPEARPISQFAFLQLLEESGSAGEQNGWWPRHLLAYRGDVLAGAAPAYLRTNSFGEFMYNDDAWPLVASMVGVDYFPRLVLCVPFTPVTGPRLLVRPGEDAGAVRRALVQGALGLARDERLGSVNVLFPADEELAELAPLGFAAGAGVQFHWRSGGARTFDEFLQRFPSHRRNTLRRERAAAAKQGISVRTLAGAEITPEAAAFAALCYERTAVRYGWDGPRLTEAYFRLAAERLGDGVEVVLAERDGRPIAGAFNLRGPGRLLGRQWGAVEDVPFLHFQVCYYHPLERCLQQGVPLFEPGAGGEHKLPRGFDPVVVRSAHRFLDARLHAALSRRLARETAGWEQAVARWDDAHARRVAGRAGSDAPG